MLQSTVELFMFKPAALHIPTLHGPMSDVTTQILIDRWCSASITRCVSNHNLCPGVPASVKYHTTHCLYGLQSPLIINTKACEASSLSVLLNSEHTQSDISMTGHTQFFSLAELHREHNLALYLTFHLFLFVVSPTYLLEVMAPFLLSLLFDKEFYKMAVGNKFLFSEIRIHSYPLLFLFSWQISPCQKTIYHIVFHWADLFDQNEEIYPVSYL